MNCNLVKISLKKSVKKRSDIKLKTKILQLLELEKVLIFDKQLKHVESMKEIEIEKNKMSFNEQKEFINKEISVLEDALKILVAELKEKGEDTLIKLILTLKHKL